MSTIAEQVVDVTQSEIDSNYIRDASYIHEFVEKDDKLLAVAVSDASDFEVLRVGEEIAVDSTEQILGYILCGSYQYREYDEYLYTDVERVLDQTEYISKSDFPIFLFQSLAVKDEYQGNGIGSYLTASAAEYAHYPFFAGAWKRESDERNISIMEKHGEHIATVPDYYPDDWDCPVCENRCSCSSVFYAYAPE